MNIKLDRCVTPPSNAVVGDCYINSIDGSMNYFDGKQWRIVRNQNPTFELEPSPEVEAEPNFLKDLKDA